MPYPPSKPLQYITRYFDVTLFYLFLAIFCLDNWVHFNPHFARQSRFKKFAQRCKFNLHAHNSGELNIDEYKIECDIDSNDYGLKSFSKRSRDGQSQKRNSSNTQLNIYPDDQGLVREFEFLLKDDEIISSESGLVCHWKLFLKDRLPIEGQIDIGGELARAFENQTEA